MKTGDTFEASTTGDSVTELESSTGPLAPTEEKLSPVVRLTVGNPISGLGTGDGDRDELEIKVDIVDIFGMLLSMLLHSTELCGKFVSEEESVTETERLASGLR